MRGRDDNHLPAADSSRPPFHHPAIADSDIAPGASHLKTSRVEVDPEFQDMIVRFYASTRVPGTVTGWLCGESTTVNYKKCMAPERSRCMAPDWFFEYFCGSLRGVGPGRGGYWVGDT